MDLIANWANKYQVLETLNSTSQEQPSDDDSNNMVYEFNNEYEFYD